MRRLLLLLLLISCEGHRVLLVFPLPTTSHSNLGSGFVRHLLQAGHHVTYITPFPVKDPPKNLRQIDVSSNIPLFPANDILDLTKLMNKEIPTLEVRRVLPLMLSIGNATVFDEDVQALLRNPNEEFDVVIAEWMFNELYCGLAAVFNCPLIWSSSMEPHAMVLSLIDQDPNPAYVTSFKSTAVPPLTFIQRVAELWDFLAIKYYKWFTTLEEASVYEEAFAPAASARGRQLPPYDEARYNASLMFGNSHLSTGSAFSLPQNYVPIAGYHISENVKALPKDFQSIMDNAKDGVILFSMGSILSSKSLPTEMKRSLLQMFGQLKQTVIWKLEETTENLPKNVHLVSFAPQQSILAHPNCAIFITHGGLLSNTEALHFGVPIIGIPVFADQFLNIDRAVQKGYAKRVELDHDIPINLKLAIEDILGSPRYRQRAKELSYVYHDRLAAPARALLHGVEHAVRTRGALHLRSPAAMLSWYQIMYLDLLALILTFVVVAGFVLFYTVSPRVIEVKKKRN